MIPPNIVESIQDAADIEDVVSDFVTLKRRGANMLGLCPFHNEKTPSFTVSPTKGIFKCFGCGKAGNSVGFIMEHEQLSYPEALRFLANKYNIEIPEFNDDSAKKAKQLNDSLYLLNEFAQAEYIKNMLETDEGKSVGLGYFKERGFIDKTIEKFKLGYAINQSQALLNRIKEAGYNLDYALKLGLIGQKDNRQYDFLRGRVIFPIHSLSGKVIAFAGRILTNDKKQPKYINSPETPIYIKNKILYGIFQAKKSIRQLDNCYLVEGYTDVISMHQAGIENVVASSGTSLTEGQIQLIKRFTQNITVLYDGDAAGIKAALRGTDMLLSADMNLKVAVLPEGEDPDSFVTKNGKNHFDSFIKENANDFILFKIKILLEEVANDPIKKTKAIRSIVESLANIPDPIKRSLYIKQSSQLLDVEEHIIISEVNKQQQLRIKNYQKQKEREARQAERAKQQTQYQAPPPQNSNFDSDGNYYPDEDDYDIPLPEEAFENKVKTLNVEANKYIHLLEKNLIRAMLLYGDKEIEEEVFVIPFVIGNILDSELSFDLPIYKQIFNEFLNGLENGELLPQSHFLNHQNQAIAQVSTQIASDVAEPSENWLTKHQVIVTPDGKHYKKEVKEILDRYKLQKITDLISQNQEKLKHLKDDTAIIEVLQVHQQLKKMQTEISKRLGLVVI